jgi:hypothetical protein
MRNILILLLFFTVGTIAEEASYKHSIAGFESESELKPFYLKVKGAILAKDYHAISTMLSFPTSLYVDGIPTRVLSKEEFIKNGNKIINERVLRAVYCSTYETLWSNYSGVMLGQGELWFNKIKGKDEDPWQTVIWKINNKPDFGSISRSDSECFFSEEVNNLFNGGQN